MWVRCQSCSPSDCSNIFFMTSFLNFCQHSSYLMNKLERTRLPSIATPKLAKNAIYRRKNWRKSRNDGKKTRRWSSTISGDEGEWICLDANFLSHAAFSVSSTPRPRLRRFPCLDAYCALFPICAKQFISYLVVPSLLRRLKQVAEEDERLKEEQYEMSKPLARYADDDDLDKTLKRKEISGLDPMLEYINRKKRKKEAKEGKGNFLCDYCRYKLRFYFAFYLCSTQCHREFFFPVSFSRRFWNTFWKSTRYGQMQEIIFLIKYPLGYNCIEKWTNQRQSIPHHN